MHIPIERLFSDFLKTILTEYRIIYVWESSVVSKKLYGRSTEKNSKVGALCIRTSYIQLTRRTTSFLTGSKFSNVCVLHNRSRLRRTSDHVLTRSQPVMVRVVHKYWKPFASCQKILSSSCLLNLYNKYTQQKTELNYLLDISILGKRTFYYGTNIRAWTRKRLKCHSYARLWLHPIARCKPG